MFKKMPFLLVAIIFTVIFLEPYMSLEIKSILYGLSLTIKSVIMLILPVIIFGLLFKVAANLASHATKVIVLIFGTVCISNFLSTLTSYSVGSWVYNFDLSLKLPETLVELEPYWTFSLPKLIENDKAMFAGVILGVVAALLNPDLATKFSKKLEKVVKYGLSSFVILIPLFVMGFMVKLQFEGIITVIIKDYAFIFAVIAISQILYIALLYLLANHFNISRFLKSLRNMVPATLTGFSTMSSAAAMPLTILGVERNSANPDLARSVVPATVNIHLIGDCLAIPIFAFAVLKNYGIEEPSFFNYLIFALYFVLAKFSVAAVPGGGILVMLPILENHLGFNGEMMSLITALYILFDPVITSANILGNGGFALAIGKLYPQMRSVKTVPSEEIIQPQTNTKA